MPSPQAVLFARAFSRFLGWIYTTAWSISFYPQPILNYRRRSTAGTTPSFPLINVLGFIFYLISTTALYASPMIRSQYAARNPKAPEPTVQANDVAFAAHAVILSTLTLSMFWKRLWGLDQGRVRVAKYIWGIYVGCLVAVAWVIILVISGSSSSKTGGGAVNAGAWAWLDVVYAMGYCKLLITVVKYIPQVYTNYSSKSTVGWSIEQILLDLVGGILSIAQLVIDSSLQADWSGLTGNPVKFGLGNVSIIFDVIFMTQHYVLYRDSDRETEEDGLAVERRGLLADEVRRY